MLLFFSSLLALGASGATISEEVAAGAAVRDDASAQVASKGSVLQQFAGYDQELSRGNFAPLTNLVQTGSLRPGANQKIALTVPAGPVLIAGFCDEGCTRLDLVLRDASGDVVSEAIYDDKPVVGWRRMAGQVSVTVRMRGCAKRSCSYGIKLYHPRPETREDREAYDDFWGL